MSHLQYKHVTTHYPLIYNPATSDLLTVILNHTYTITLGGFTWYKEKWLEGAYTVTCATAYNWTGTMDSPHFFWDSISLYHDAGAWHVHAEFYTVIGPGPTYGLTSRNWSSVSDLCTPAGSYTGEGGANCGGDVSSDYGTCVVS